MKDQVPGNYNIIPFGRLFPIMVIEMVYTTVLWRNMFTLRGGLSKAQSPSEIILNCGLNFNAQYRIEPIKYIGVHTHIRSMTAQYNHAPLEPSPQSQAPMREGIIS